MLVFIDGPAQLAELRQKERDIEREREREKERERERQTQTDRQTSIESTTGSSKKKVSSMLTTTLVDWRGRAPKEPEAPKRLSRGILGK